MAAFFRNRLVALMVMAILLVRYATTGSMFGGDATERYTVLSRRLQGYSSAYDAAYLGTADLGLLDTANDPSQPSMRGPRGETPQQCTRKYILSLNDTSPCVHTKEYCEAENIFDYAGFHFCVMYEAGVEWLSYIVLILWLCVIFVATGTAADEFLVPSLEVISKTLKLTQNVAGVTFLAFGNGAADVFGAYASLSGSNAGLAIGQIIGAGTFVVCIVVSIIAWSHRFSVTRRPFIRDVVMYIGAVSYMLGMLVDGEVSLGESVGLIVWYVVYVLLVVLGRQYRQYMKRKRGLLLDDGSTAEKIAMVRTDEPDSGTTTPADVEEGPPSVPTTDDLALGAAAIPSKDYLGTAVAAETSEKFRGSLLAVSVRHAEPVADNADAPLLAGPISTETLEDGTIVNIVKTEVPLSVVDLLFPIIHEWRHLNWYRRINAIVATPFIAAYVITVPVVDIRRKDRRFNKWILRLNCLTMPLWFIICTRNAMVPLGNNFYLWQLFLIISICTGLFGLWITRKGERPSFFNVFAFFALPMAAVWLYTICDEMIALFTVLGRLLGISDTILGLTILSWGGSLGGTLNANLIASPAIARKGFPQMAISACYGGPLLNLLLGLGVGFTANIATNGGLPFVLPKSTVQVISVCGLLLVLVYSLVYVIINKFRIHRPFAISLIALYAALVIVDVATEISGV